MGNEKTKGIDRNINRKSTNNKKSRSRSRPRSRSREKNKKKKEENTKNVEDIKTLNEEERYYIKQHQKELNQKTFTKDKQKELDKLSLKQCSKRTTKNDVLSLRERYLKRKSLKKNMNVIYCILAPLALCSNVPEK